MASRSNLLIPVLFIIFLAAAFSANAHPSDFIVFDVRKTLPLHDGEQVYRDYYVNIGTETGVRPGSILAVYRRIPVVDVYRNKAQGDLIVPVAHLRVIHSQRTMSVCRLAGKASGSQVPVVDYEAVMMGDRVEVAGNDMGPEKNPNDALGKTAEVSADPETTTGEAARSPAAEAKQMNTRQPAKVLPQKRKQQQAKPDVKAVPIPAQAAIDTSEEESNQI